MLEVPALMLVRYVVSPVFARIEPSTVYEALAADSARRSGAAEPADAEDPAMELPAPAIHAAEVAGAAVVPWPQTSADAEDGGEYLTFDKLAMRSPLGKGTDLLRGPAKAHKAKRSSARLPACRTARRHGRVQQGPQV